MVMWNKAQGPPCDIWIQHVQLMTGIRSFLRNTQYSVAPMFAHCTRPMCNNVVLEYRYREALPLCERAVQIFETAMGEDNGNVATALVMEVNTP